MRKWKVIDHDNPNESLIRNSNFSISFDNKEFWPYEFLYDRKRLYYDDKLEERWSYFFPLKEKEFWNTEIFIERNDIVITIWKRWSFSGKSKRFIEVVNLSSANKYRFYPEEVSLIYNSKTHIVLYYKKSWAYKCLKLSIDTLEKSSETSIRLSAFFKLLYNHSSDEYIRLLYKANSRSHMSWYFVEEKLENKKIIKKDIPWLNMSYNSEPTGLHSKPDSFNRSTFLLRTKTHQKIDVWQASLTWIL